MSQSDDGLVWPWHPRAVDPGAQTGSQAGASASSGGFRGCPGPSVRLGSRKMNDCDSVCPLVPHELRYALKNNGTAASAWPYRLPPKQVRPSIILFVLSYPYPYPYPYRISYSHSHSIPFHPISSHPIPSYPIPSCPVLPVRPVLSYPVSFRFVSFRFVSSRLVLFCLLLSCPGPRSHAHAPTHPRTLARLQANQVFFLRCDNLCRSCVTSPLYLMRASRGSHHSSSFTECP